MKDDDYILGYLNGKGFIADSASNAIQLWIGAQKLDELREYGIFVDGKIKEDAARKAILRCAKEDKITESEGEE